MSDSYKALFEHETGELNLNRQNSGLFERYIDEYESLKKTLSTFADKSKYNLMVPVAGSDLAFMPGHIHHTNEVLVMIGDNYFVEKSTKEAAQFVERRLVFCRERLKELEDQKKMLLDWASITESVISEKEDLVDITETETDEQYEQWLNEHRKRATKAAATSKVEEKFTSTVPKNLFDRLEELERQEEDNNELGVTRQEQLEKTITRLETITLKEKESSTSSANVSLPAPMETAQQAGRPMSKFKASRMNRK